ncbi:MAG: hypothetical protein ACE5KG_03840, partial [Nitrososphaerales archaeon]
GTVAKKLMTAFSTIKPWSLAEFGEMVAAQAEIAQTLNGVAGVIKAHGRYVTYFFKDDLRKIQSELGKMEKLSSDLAKHISEKKPRFDSITDLIGAAETYGSIQTSVLADKATLSDLNEALAGARRDQSNLLSKIKEVEQTEGFKSSSGTKQKVDALESDVSGLNTTFEADMTRVNKPLRKYLYSASLNKNQQKLLGDYLKSPSETILIDSDLAIIPILSDVGEEMGKLEGNPKQSEKMKNHLKVLISSIPDTKQRLQEITEQIQENRASTQTDEVRRHGDLKDEDLRRKRIIEEQEESVKRLKSKIEQDDNNLKGLQTKLVEKMDEMFSIRIPDDRK